MIAKCCRQRIRGQVLHHNNMESDGTATGGDCMRVESPTQPLSGGSQPSKIHQERNVNFIVWKHRHELSPRVTTMEEPPGILQTDKIVTY